MPDTQYRTCNKCNEEKDVLCFTVKSKGKQILRRQCTDCVNKTNLARYYRNQAHNQEYSRNRNAKLRMENPDFRRANVERSKAWIKEHPERYSALLAKGNAARRARVSGSVGSYSVEDWIQLQKDYCGCCAYCGKKPNKLDADHVVPLSLGGVNSIDNILPSCDHCNSTKHNTPLLIWMWRNVNYG